MSQSIIPPPELLKQWKDDWFDDRENVDVLLIQAFQAGADQELQAVCQLLFSDPSASYTLSEIRAARRPKPPSLKEQALLAIDTAVADDRLSADVAAVVRRALEALPE